jgi:stage II sporulation protein P
MKNKKEKVMKFKLLISVSIIMVMFMTISIINNNNFVMGYTSVAASNNEETNKDNTSEFYEKPNIIKHQNDKPLIFIYHTHATESYKSQSDNNYHSLEKEDTVIKVGEELKKQLEDLGHMVIHDESINDYPKFKDSYKNALATVEKNLKENPSLRLIFDINREYINNVDNLESEEYKKIRKNSVTKINGENVAKYSIVIGCKNNNVEELKKLAYHIRNISEELYPGLIQPLVLKDFKYNQYKSDYSTRFLIGNNITTIEEAVQTTKYLGEIINKAMENFVVNDKMDD